MLATDVAADMTTEVTFNIFDPANTKLVHNMFIWKMKVAHTPRIL